MLVRSAVAGTGAICGILTYLTHDPTKTGISTPIFVMCNTLLGTFIAHTAIVYPLYEKRARIRNACNAIITDIKNNFYSNNPTANERLKEIMSIIMSASLANEKRDQATLTWSFRWHLLKNLELFLLHSNEVQRQAFINQPMMSLLNDLTKMRIYTEDDNINSKLHENLSSIMPKMG